MLHRRRAGRVILLDAQQRLLLLQGRDPSSSAAHWWFTPGGGAEADETQKEAALRELKEETGLELDDVQGPIWIRHASFDFNGDHYEQSEEFFLAHIDSHAVDRAGWTDLEQQTVLDVRWWSLPELKQTREVIYPVEIAQLIDELIDHGVPTTPIQLSTEQ